VPSYVGFVTGLTVDELREWDRADARRQAVHAALFVLGSSLIFLALGASATALGGVLRRSLPLLQQVGGIVIAASGLYLLGVLRMPVPEVPQGGAQPGREVVRPRHSSSERRVIG
jgi:cytochrome c-type biogenesis protein